MTDFSSTTIHTAKKDYICEACRTKILKGEKYTKNVGLYEGDFFSYPLHNDCESCMQAYFGEFLYYDDEMPWIYELEKEELPWVEKEFPEVYERIKHD